MLLLKQKKKKKVEERTEVKEMKKKVTPHMAQTAKVSPRKGRNQYESKGRHHYHLPRRTTPSDVPHMDLLGTSRYVDAFEMWQARAQREKKEGRNED